MDISSHFTLPPMPAELPKPDVSVMRAPPKIDVITFLGTKIPVVKPEEAPEPTAFPRGTHIDLARHTPSYVVRAVRDENGHLHVPMEGKHLPPGKKRVVYDYYITDDAGKTTAFYSGISTHMPNRLKTYRHDIKEAAKSEKARKFEAAVLKAPNVFWGVATLPRSKRSMFRHEKRRIELARAHAKDWSFEVLNVQAGKKDTGPVTTPSPVKVAASPVALRLLKPKTLFEDCGS